MRPLRGGRGLDRARRRDTGKVPGGPPSALGTVVLRRRVPGDRDAGNRQTVRNAIRKLRRKLGDDARDPQYILGERGVGCGMSGPEGA